LPVCPHCGKLIAEKKYEKHLRKHGTHHRRNTPDLYVPSAVPPWEGVNRGILVGPHRKWSRRKRLAIYLVVALGFAAAGIIYLVFWVLALV